MAMNLKPESSGEPSQSTSLRAFFRRDVVVVLMVAWAARLTFILLMPVHTRSFDSLAWETVLSDLSAGQNPYQTTHFLSWPPFWLQVLFVISKISTALSIPFFRVLQAVLILVESIVIVLLVKLVREVVPETRVRALVILGIALNPAAVFLICQHCNFDVFVALWLMFFMLHLVRYSRGKNEADWLAACLFLGLGILTKTVPFILIPMLAGGFREAAKLVKFLGLVLVFGPAALGMSVIYVLAPSDATSKILQYHGIGGSFGFAGLFRMAGMEQITSFYNLFFYGLLFAAMISTSILFWRHRFIGSREIVLLASLFLVGIAVLGPAYAPQYLYWFLPFLVATFAFFDKRWQQLLMGFGLIAACTYLVEYALVGSDGMFLLKILTVDKSTLYQAVSLLPVIQACESPTGSTLIRLPLFLAYLVLLGMGISMLFRRLKNHPDRQI